MKITPKVISELSKDLSRVADEGFLLSMQYGLFVPSERIQEAEGSYFPCTDQLDFHSWMSQESPCFTCHELSTGECADKKKPFQCSEWWRVYNPLLKLLLEPRTTLDNQPLSYLVVIGMQTNHGQRSWIYSFGGTREGDLFKGVNPIISHLASSNLNKKELRSNVFFSHHMESELTLNMSHSPWYTLSYNNRTRSFSDCAGLQYNNQGQLKIGRQVFHPDSQRDLKPEDSKNEETNRLRSFNTLVSYCKEVETLGGNPDALAVYNMWLTKLFDAMEKACTGSAASLPDNRTLLYLPPQRGTGQKSLGGTHTRNATAVIYLTPQGRQVLDNLGYGALTSAFHRSSVFFHIKKTKKDVYQILDGVREWTFEKSCSEKKNCSFPPHVFPTRSQEGQHFISEKHVICCGQEYYFPFLKDLFGLKKTALGSNWESGVWINTIIELHESLKHWKQGKLERRLLYLILFAYQCRKNVFSKDSTEDLTLFFKDWLLLENLTIWEEPKGNFRKEKKQRLEKWVEEFCGLLENLLNDGHHSSTVIQCILSDISKTSLSFVIACASPQEAANLSKSINSASLDPESQHSIQKSCNNLFLIGSTRWDVSENRVEFINSEHSKKKTKECIVTISFCKGVK